MQAVDNRSSENSPNRLKASFCAESQNEVLSNTKRVVSGAVLRYRLMLARTVVHVILAFLDVRRTDLRVCAWRYAVLRRVQSHAKERRLEHHAPALQRRPARHVHNFCSQYFLTSFFPKTSHESSHI